MTLERTLNDAHRLLRKGMVDGAIAAYAAVLEDRPDDWPAANRLGDLYMQTGRIPEAIEQFTRVAQQLLDRHLLSKAAALYKKVLKIVPEDEHARMQLAEIAERQGFLVDARAHLTSVAEHRRLAGDEQGAMDLERRLQGMCDAPSDGRTTATATPAATGPPRHAEPRVGIGLSLAPATAAGLPGAPQDRTPEPLAFSQDRPASGRGPAPRPEATQVGARVLDPELRLQVELVEREFRAGRLRRARELVDTVLADAPDGANQILDLAKQLAGELAEATLVCADAILDAGRRHSNWNHSAQAVRDLAESIPTGPEGRHWSPDQVERLERTGAAARLETMRRERAAILRAFPDLAPATDTPERGWIDSTAGAALPESAVAAAV